MGATIYRSLMGAMSLLLATLIAARPALAEIREVTFHPKTVVQHVTDRIKAEKSGGCWPGQIIGSAPSGFAMMEDLGKSAFVGYHETHSENESNFVLWMSCWQPRSEVMQFRVLLVVNLDALPPGNKPFYSFLEFKAMTADAAHQAFPSLPPANKVEVLNGSAKSSAFLTGVSVQAKKGMLCASQSKVPGHMLSFMFAPSPGGGGEATNGCGSTSMPGPEGQVVPITKLLKGTYTANITPLLMAARKAQQKEVWLVIHSVGPPSGATAWPSTSSSALMSLSDWTVTVLGNKCNWNTNPFPGSC